MADALPPLFGRADLAERIAKAKDHMHGYRQHNEALWPHQPFAMTLGELLDAAERGLKAADEIERLRAALSVQGGPLQLWCETCEGTGKVYQEHQRGCHVGGDHPCPDCDGKGYVLSRRYSLAAPAVPPTVEAAHAMGAKGGPVVEAERLAFEAWMAGHCWALSATWTGTQYRSDAEQGCDLDPRAMATRRLWAAWRDRAALAAAPSAPGAEGGE